MAQYPANIDLSSLDGTLKLSGEAANDLSSASVASTGDVNDNHSVTVTKNGTPHGNVPATVTADTSNLVAALGTPAVSLIADTTNGTGGSLSWTSPSILAQWNIFRPAINGSRR